MVREDSQGSNNFKYDVFVSYRAHEPDLSWVRTFLVPRLETSGLIVCVDYKCFRPGALILKEIGRAIEQSRYTVGILSPGYLESNFTEVENIMAEHLGLVLSQRRLLMVMRESCKPRLGIQARLWLDMVAGEQVEVNLARLLYELRQTPEL